MMYAFKFYLFYSNYSIAKPETIKSKYFIKYVYVIILYAL